MGLIAIALAMLLSAEGTLMVGVDSPQPAPEVIELLEDGTRAVLVFESAVPTSLETRRLTQRLACAAGAPLIVAVDQEVGRVTRLKGFVTALPAADTYQDDLRAASARLASEMVALGINLDLAPVADVISEPNPVLRGRTFGDDPRRVASMVTAMVFGLHEGGVGATLKHFPGHGRSATDPHHARTVIDASLDELWSTDLLPFPAGIAAGADAVMVGHPIYTAIDPERPASLSPAVYSLLRDDLGFDGVAITDGMAMRSVRQGRTLEAAAVEALSAGADLLIFEKPTEAVRAAAALADVARVEEATRRVARLADSLPWWGCWGHWRPLAIPRGLSLRGS